MWDRGPEEDECPRSGQDDRVDRVDDASMWGRGTAGLGVLATARLHDATLVTSDADFAGLPDVIYLPKG